MSHRTRYWRWGVLGICLLTICLSATGCRCLADYPDGEIDSRVRADVADDGPADAAADGVQDAPETSADTSIDSTDLLVVADGCWDPPSTDLPKPYCTGRWCWENPLPHGNDLHAVYGFAANAIWAVGKAGTLMSATGEAPWAVDASELHHFDLQDIHVAGADLFIVGGDTLFWGQASAALKTHIPKVSHRLKGVWAVPSDDYKPVVWFAGDGIYGKYDLHNKVPAIGETPRINWESIWADAQRVLVAGAKVGSSVADTMAVAEVDVTSLAATDKAPSILGRLMDVRGVGKDGIFVVGRHGVTGGVAARSTPLGGWTPLRTSRGINAMAGEIATNSNLLTNAFFAGEQGLAVGWSAAKEQVVNLSCGQSTFYDVWASDDGATWALAGEKGTFWLQAADRSRRYPIGVGDGMDIAAVACSESRTVAVGSNKLLSSTGVPGGQWTSEDLPANASGHSLVDVASQGSLAWAITEKDIIGYTGIPSVEKTFTGGETLVAICAYGSAADSEVMVLGRNSWRSKSWFVATKSTGWSQREPKEGLRDEMRDLACTKDSFAVVGQEYGTAGLTGIIRTATMPPSDGFATIAVPIGSASPNAIWMQDAKNYVVVSKGGKVFHRTAGHLDMAPAGNGDLSGVWNVGPNQFLLVGAGGAVFRGSGKTWNREYIGTQHDLRDICAAPTSGATPSVVVVGKHGTIIRKQP